MIPIKDKYKNSLIINVFFSKAVNLDIKTPKVHNDYWMFGMLFISQKLGFYLFSKKKIKDEHSKSVIN